MTDLLLVFDTATAATAVGVAAPGRDTVVRRHDPAVGERPGHATRLLGLVDEAVTAAGAELGDVTHIGVGVGPGSFTGLRIGVATGRAIALSTGARTTAVSTLDAVAHGAGAGDGAVVLAVLDARRGEVFVSAWAGGRRVSGPVAVAPDVLPAIAARDAPGGVAVGDGAVRYRPVLEAAGVAVPPDGDPLHRVDGRALAELARDGAPVAREDLLPDYVRRPDVDA